MTLEEEKMRFFFAVLAVFAVSGCFGASMGLRSQGVEYSASGFMGPSPMEAAQADLTSAQADRVRAEARAMEAHPELFLGYRGYGYGGYGRVDPSYYYPSSYGPSPALETRATGLERDVQELTEMCSEHIEEEQR